MDFVPCPKCGTFNPPAATDCQECKSPLDAEMDAPALTFKADPPPEPEPEPQPPAPAHEPAAAPATFETTPEVRAKIDALEAGIAQKPLARALYLQLAQIYTDAKRADLAAAVLERGIAADPGNVYLRHKLAQVTGKPEARVPEAKVAETPPPARPGATMAATPVMRTAAPSLPRVAPPAARMGWVKKGLAVAAVLAIAAVVKIVVFPSTRQLVAGNFRAEGAVWSPTGKHLAFVLTDSTGAHLAVYDFASKEHAIVGDLENWGESAFSWAPDGRQIAYTGRAPAAEGEWAASAIRVYDLATGKSNALASGSSPRWRSASTILAVCAPEGRSFASDSEDGYTAFDSSMRFCRIDPASGTVTRAALQADYGMSVSPLLDRVVFEQFAEGAGAVETATMEASAGGDGEFQDMADAVVAGRAQNVVEGARDLNRELEARKFVAKRKAAGRIDRLPMDMEVFAADIDGGQPVKIAAAGEAGLARWTPAGDRILFARNGAAGIEYWTMRDDGSDRQPLLTGVKVADLASVSLSADGKDVFFVATVPGDPALAKLMTGEEPADLHVVRAGSAPRRLANKHSFKHRYAVSPDGKRVVYEVLQDVKMIGGEAKSELWLMNR